MAEGGGKYGEICDEIFERLKARLVILLVSDGVHGTGFSLSTEDKGYLLGLPDALEEMADKIRDDIKRMKEKGEFLDG